MRYMLITFALVFDNIVNQCVAIFMKPLDFFAVMLALLFFVLLSNALDFLPLRTGVSALLFRLAIVDTSCICCG